MKAIRRFLSPSDASTERTPPRRSMSMRFRSPATKPRPLSQHSVLSANSGLSAASAASGVSSSYSSFSQAGSLASRPPMRAGGGARGRRGRSVIDAEDYPRVVACIMNNASRPALLKLRLVSKSFRDMADARLAQHLILSAPVGVSSLRVTAPAEGPNPTTAETGIPGLSVRVLWSRDERRRLTRILTGTQVIDLRGPARAREPEIGDLTLQCSCARTVRLRPDASGNPPTSCPLPPRVTQLIAFTTLAADGASPTAEKANRRSSWLVTDREHLHLQPASTAYVGPVPNRIQNLVVTVKYPAAHELAPAPGSRTPARPLRPLAPWDHPNSLREVTVIFMVEEARKQRPRSFLGINTNKDANSETTPIFERHATLKPSGSKRMSWRGSSPVSPKFPSPSITPTSENFHPVDPAFPAVPVKTPTSPASVRAPVLTFSDADADRARDLSALGFLTPFIRSVAAHLPRVQYTLVDASRIDPVVLGLSAGTLLSPRQIERMFTKALRAELDYTGWDEEEIEHLLTNLTFTNKLAYSERVGAAAFELQTVE